MSTGSPHAQLAPQPAAATAPSPRPRNRRRLVIGGVCVVGVVAGAVFGILAADKGAQLASE